MADPTYKGHPSFTGNPDAVTVDQFNQYPDITQLEDTIDANTAQPSAEVATMVAKWYVHKMLFCFFHFVHFILGCNNRKNYFYSFILSLVVFSVITASKRNSNTVH